MEIIKKNKKLFLKTILFFTFLIFGFVYAFANIANYNVERQEHRKAISEEIQKNKYEAVQGTAVPNTGYVEKVYVNTNIEENELLKILSNIDFTPQGELYGYPVFVESNNAYHYIMIQSANSDVYSQSDLVIVYQKDEENIYLYDKNGHLSGFKGFNPNLVNPIEINANASSDMGGMIIGDQNSKLINLFSITPFVEENETTLIEIIGNGIADSVSGFGEVITNVFEAAKKLIFNEDNTLNYIGSALAILVSCSIVSFTLKLILRIFTKNIKVG